MDLERAISIVETGSKLPEFPHTADEVDEACKIICETLKKLLEQIRGKCNFCAYRWEGCVDCERGSKWELDGRSD